MPGVQYYYVTTAYAAPGSQTDGGPFIGNFRNIITGAGQVTLGVVPEPGSGWFLATLACLACWNRRKTWSRAMGSV